MYVCERKCACTFACVCVCTEKTDYSLVFLNHCNTIHKEENGFFYLSPYLLVAMEKLCQNILQTERNNLANNELKDQAMLVRTPEENGLISGSEGCLTYKWTQ